MTSVDLDALEVFVPQYKPVRDSEGLFNDAFKIALVSLLRNYSSRVLLVRHQRVAQAVMSDRALTTGNPGEDLAPHSDGEEDTTDKEDAMDVQ